MPVPILQGVAGPSDASTRADAHLAQSLTNGVNGTHHEHDQYANDIVKESYLFSSGRGRKFRVVVVGAGAAGIYAGIQIPRELPDVELQIYEKNEAFSGVWHENRYPGAACDIPAQVYCYSFEAKPDWSNFYAEAPEIKAYFSGTAEKYGVRKYTKFEHRVTAATWDESSGTWKLKVTDNHGKTIDDFCDVLMNAGGLLNAWRWPNIEGLDTFKGKRVHSANWDDEAVFDDKTTVAVIGNGSSGIQIVPQLQPKVKHLDTYIRNKTWIALPLTSGGVREKAQAAGMSGDDVIAALYKAGTSNPPYSEEQKKRFAEDPMELYRYRKAIDNENNGRFASSVRMDSEPAKAAIPMLTKIMKDRLARKPELWDKLIPEWHVGCRRLTPGVGYLEALTEDNVDVVTEPIDRIVPEGIKTKDGVVHPCDVLVCATGFDVSTRPHFKVSGRDGYYFSDEWAKAPRSYLSLTNAHMPNYFVFMAANGPLANGSLIPCLEAACDYMIKVIRKMDTQDIKSVCIKSSAEDSFTQYTDAWMPRAIWSSTCKSWYKNGTETGRVSAIWPGSALHYMAMLKEPRFEDYDYTHLFSNPMSYMGNGFTINDIDPKMDKAPYLDDPLRPGNPRVIPVEY